MTRLAISVEGQTEEEFVKESLAAHLQSRGIYVQPVLIHRARRRVQGGGNVTVDALATEMRHLLHSHDAVTSLVDFYGFKGKGNKSPEILVQAIRDRMGATDERYVLPYVQVYEFEGLLFSDVTAFERVFSDPPIAKLSSIRSDFDTPEDINDSSETAPSKRIGRNIQGYQKAKDGPLLALEIGLDGIRRECPRFNAWLCRLESLGQV